MLEPGRNCWRIERANRAALVVDAANYFRLARDAMLAAEQQILMIGWDFDTRIDLVPECEDEAPDELGAFISYLPKRRKDLQVHILKWNLGALKLFGRGTTMLRIARWASSPNIHFKLDGAHAVGASHHQKILVIDDRLAFCGGIDMTADRWDTREHRDDDPRRKRPTTRRAYCPWHDATMAVDGDAARALGDLARKRWLAAGGKPITAPSVGSEIWPEGLKPQFQQVDVAIARTRGGSPYGRAIREIEALFVDQIARANRIVYAENQYFSSRVIAAAVIKRLSDPDCPEFVIVNPKSAGGWLEHEAMSPARARILQEIRDADVSDRFRIYSPVTEGGEDIYVHSKILIVDDQLIRVGSANMNNRSLGLDSECDLTIDTALEANRNCGGMIGNLLHDLLAEHLGTEPANIDAEIGRKKSYIAMIDGLCGQGRSLIPLRPDPPSEAEQKLAESELLDPESAGEDFEPMARPGLLKGMRSRA